MIFTIHFGGRWGFPPYFWFNNHRNGAVGCGHVSNENPSSLGNTESSFMGMKIINQGYIRIPELTNQDFMESLLCFFRGENVFIYLLVLSNHKRHQPHVSCDDILAV